MTQDAQVICELYQTLGTAFLTKLKGDFAFVCYDSRKVSLTTTYTQSLLTTARHTPNQRQEVLTIANQCGVLQQLS